MKHLPLPATGLVVAVALALAACSKAPDTAAPAAPRRRRRPPPSPPPAVADAADGIAWKKASSDADIEAAFAVARAETKPVFLYWGAKWCPPCNQVQATLFNRQDFIERSRAFVPVYVDGDSPGAQKLGTRFRVSGYPTMLMLKPSGEEVTRLPGEVDPARYTELLNLGMNAARPVKAVLADALAGGKDLKAERLAPARLLFLGHRPDPGARQGRGRHRPWPSSPPPARPTSPRRRCAFASRRWPRATPRRRPRPTSRPAPPCSPPSPTPAAARDVADLLVNFADDIVRALAAPGTPERAETLATFDTALQRLEADKHALARRPDAGADRPGRPGADRPSGGRRQAGARRPSCRSRCSPTSARRRPAPTARSPTATSARRSITVGGLPARAGRPRRPSPTPCSRPTSRRATRPTT